MGDLIGKGILTQGTHPGAKMEEHVYSAYLDGRTILDWHYNL